MQTDLYGKIVEMRLEQWGREFAYHRDRVRAGGYRTKDMLQVLIEHKGEMPPRPTGWKPEEVDLMALEIEDLVRELFHEQRDLAWVLRAFYCGNGRRGHERWEFFNALTGKRRSRRQYYDMLDEAKDAIRAKLNRLARAA